MKPTREIPLFRLKNITSVRAVSVRQRTQGKFHEIRPSVAETLHGASEIHVPPHESLPLAAAPTRYCFEHSEIYCYACCSKPGGAYPIEAQK